MAHSGSGSGGASFDKKRLPLHFRAAMQASRPNTMPTECHGWRFALAARPGRFESLLLSIHIPEVNVT
jgi:hypothetical protein